MLNDNFDLVFNGFFKSILIIVLLIVKLSFRPSIITTSSILKPPSKLFKTWLASLSPIIYPGFTELNPSFLFIPPLYIL